jgi:hypothetical protein
MWREPSGQKELKSSAMIALLDAASWFFQASHWATSRAEIASVNSGIETLCAISMSVPFVRSFWAATTLPSTRTATVSHRMRRPLLTSVSS